MCVRIYSWQYGDIWSGDKRQGLACHDSENVALTYRANTTDQVYDHKQLLVVLK